MSRELKDPAENSGGPAQPFTIEQVLAENGVYVSTTAGVSMWPMLRNRRDTVIIRPVTGRLKKYDVPLYRRGSAYILHRILRVLPDSYVICGDNCAKKEYGITDAQLVGVLTEFYRGSRKVSLDAPFYRLYVRLWCFIGPPRRLLYRLRTFAVRLLHR